MDFKGKDVTMAVDRVGTRDDGFPLYDVEVYGENRMWHLHNVAIVNLKYLVAVLSVEFASDDEFKKAVEVYKADLDGLARVPYWY